MSASRKLKMPSSELKYRQLKIAAKNAVLEFETIAKCLPESPFKKQGEACARKLDEVVNG